jgi:hypothetical protein
LNSELIWKIWKISVLVIITPKETSLLLQQQQQQPYTPQSSSSHAHPRTAAAIAKKFHPKHEKQKQNETHYENITH